QDVLLQVAEHRQGLESVERLDQEGGLVDGDFGGLHQLVPPLWNRPTASRVHSRASKPLANVALACFTTQPVPPNKVVPRRSVTATGTAPSPPETWSAKCMADRMSLLRLVCCRVTVMV